MWLPGCSCGQSRQQLTTHRLPERKGDHGKRTIGKRLSKTDVKPGGDGATTGYEAQLWRMADALRGSMDAAEYKHVVLGLVFLKYISDAFEERHAAVLAEWGAEAAEDRDEYIAENIFWVPPEARWRISRPKRASRPSASSSTSPWPASSATTRRSRRCCPKTTPAPPSTSSGSANSST